MLAGCMGYKIIVVQRGSESFRRSCAIKKGILPTFCVTQVREAKVTTDAAIIYERIMGWDCWKVKKKPFSWDVTS